MMKIYITGSTGSGKTTAALELSQRHRIAAYSVDEIVWDNSKGFTGTRHPDEVRDGRIAEILGMQSWVAEGIYFKDERDKIPGLTDLLNREGINYYLYSGNNAAEYVSEEIV